VLQRLRRLRWWWWIGVGWIVGYGLLWVVLTGNSAIRRAIFSKLFLALIPLLMGVAWLIVVAPMLEARVERFTDRAPARRRARISRVFAWLPSVIFGGLLVQITVVRLFDIGHFGWFYPGYGWMVAGAFALSIFYGRRMSRHLEKRVRDAATRAESCFRCNYRLTNLTADRCPECGEPLRRATPPDTMEGPGDADDA
jgi:hypothetical protein